MISPSQLGEYINHGSCPKFAKLNQLWQSDANNFPEDWDGNEAFMPINQLLAEQGNSFEEYITDKVTTEYSINTVMPAEDWSGNDPTNKYTQSNVAKNYEVLLDYIRDAAVRMTSRDDPLFLEQIPFKGTIEQFEVTGDSDIMIIEPQAHNGVRIRIFDVKASWEEKTYHRVQTACYTLLLRKLLEANQFDEPVDFTIEGGIINRETVFPLQFSLDELPNFNPIPVEDDVRRLLSSDSELYSALTTEHTNIDYQLSNAWRNGPFTEYGVTESVEEAHIRLLEVTRGEQQVLEKHGFNTIYDVADIIPVPDDPRPYEYERPEIKEQYQDAVLNLQESGALNESIIHLAQRAQSLLSNIDPEHPNAYIDDYGRNQQWKIGTGQGRLPDDDPHFERDDIQNKSLIRTYLNVQTDHIRDSIVMLSAQIDCSLYDGDPLTVGKIVDDIPNEPPYNTEDAQSLTRRLESELISEFLEDLNSAIKFMSELTNQEGEASLHFYFYEKSERTSLVEGLRRNSRLSLCRSYRDLLSMKEGVDQKMVSFIEPEIESRLSRDEFSTGITQQYRKLYPFKQKQKVSQEELKYTDDDGDTYSFKRIFSQNLFSSSAEYVRTEDGLDLFPDETDDPFVETETDGWYPVRPRFGAQIPLEYIWGCQGIDAFDESRISNPQYKYIMKRFFYYGDKDTQKRITQDMVRELGVVFAKMVGHLERSLTFRNADIDKQPLDLDNLDTFSIGDSTLQQGMMEYLDLEYMTNRQEVMDLYRTPLKKRIVNGNAVPFRVKNAVDEGGVLTVDAELLYDEFDFLNPERIAGSARVQGSGESSGGSRRVATPMEETSNGWTEDIDKPSDIEHSPVASVETFKPDENHISLKFFPNGASKNDRYQTWHKRPSETVGDQYTYSFTVDETFVLDEQADDMTSERTRDALKDAPGNNMIYHYLSEMSKNNSVDTFTDVAKEEYIDEFIGWLNENYFPSPNDKQEQFIRDVTSKFHLLQGPPGTGKTSGATSLAVLARAFANGRNGDALRGMITGASNKAIDEVMEDIHDALVEFKEKTNGETPIDNLQLIRLTGNPPDNQLDEVAYTPIYDNQDVINQIYRHNLSETRQATLGDSSPQHTLIFTTPSTFKKFIDAHPDVVKHNDGAEAEDKINGFEEYRSLFDLLCVDEASMLSLPQLAMSGAHISEDAQVILSGDQRQMPPVQQYEWLDEDRRTIEEVVPFLSSLDFFRLLRGDDLEQLQDEHWDSLPANYNANIPITRLQTTYRCHTDVAEFLREWIYAQDGIQYDSDQTYTIPPIDSNVPTSIANILDKDTPITLILHEDESSRQSNRIEAKIAREIVDTIPPNQTTGVVTPHNAQKGLLNTMTDRAQVDTVERFQGGQRDVMLVSATVSDPDFLSAESEFILNPNRLNVALSRMKKKLVVIAPKTLFTLLPDDTDAYEDSIIWKGLYKEVEVSDTTPRWSGVLEDITQEDEDIEDNVRIEVYSNH